ncbi:unnamed protein product [Amoebophrya sp. A120]|nr:unnamed protein product [Amoebophrya sp. A120]|eukprot:GSA120T00023114001.1
MYNSKSELCTTQRVPGSDTVSSWTNYGEDTIYLEEALSLLERTTTLTSKSNIQTTLSAIYRTTTSHDIFGEKDSYFISPHKILLATPNSISEMHFFETLVTTLIFLNLLAH